MTKKEAVERFVSRDFAGIPQEWVQIVAESKGEEIYAWPMWGTMWIVDEWIGKKLMENAEQEGCPEHYSDWTEGCDGCADMDEEMIGAYRISGTAAYIYEVDGIHVIGIHGAGWNFYDGVWDKLYDLMGLEWHSTEPESESEEGEAVA